MCDERNLHRQIEPAQESLRAAIQQGLDDVVAGRITTFSGDEELDAFFEDLKQRGRREMRSRRLPS